jgi:hypothetical protein
VKERKRGSRFQDEPIRCDLDGSVVVVCTKLVRS